jgi:hypothetical protein
MSCEYRRAGSRNKDPLIRNQNIVSYSRTSITPLQQKDSTMTKVEIPKRKLAANVLSIIQEPSDIENIKSPDL